MEVIAKTNVKHVKTLLNVHRLLNTTTDGTFHNNGAPIYNKNATDELINRINEYSELLICWQTPNNLDEELSSFNQPNDDATKRNIIYTYLMNV